MKKFTLLASTLCLALVALLGSCTKDTGKMETFDKPDITKPGGGGGSGGETYNYTLKQLAASAGIRMGVATTYDEYMTTTGISTIINREFDNVTFGNEMKNSSIMQDDGSLYFTRTDNLMAKIKTDNPDMKFFGHVLGWHSQQRTAYLNGLVQNATETYAGQKFFTNFENGTALNSWGGTDAMTQDPRETFAGDYAMKLTTATAGTPYSHQAQVSIPAMEVGKTYILSFWLKALNTGGKIRVSTSDLQYLPDGNTTTSWAQYSYTFTVSALPGTGNYFTNIDLGYVANTYFLDNVRVVQATAAPINYGDGNGGAAGSMIGSNSVMGVDGTFEQAPGTGEVAKGWTALNGASGISVATAHYYSGAKALKVDDSAKTTTARYNIQVVSGAYTITPGTAYTISFWAMTPDGAETMQLESRKPSGTTYSAYYTPTSTWTQYTYNVTTTASDITMAVAFDCGLAKGTIYIDDVNIYPTSEGLILGSVPTNLLGTAGTFETTQTFDGANANWVKNGSIISAVTQTTTQKHGGNQSLQVDISAAGADYYAAQIMTPVFAVTPGTSYTCTFWIMSPNSTSIQTSLRSYNTSPAGDWSTGTESAWTNQTISPAWSKVTVTFTASAGSAYYRISMNTGKFAGTYYIDDVVVNTTASLQQTLMQSYIYKSPITKTLTSQTTGSRAPGDPVISTDTKSENAQDRVDYALKQWVFGMVQHYGNSVYAWDAVNEIFNDAGGTLRSNNKVLQSGIFYWGDFLGGGDKFAQKVFKYARAVRTDGVLLYINDYNLEGSTKCSAFCSFVNANSALIDGVGTQMHISVNTTRTQMDAMFVALAATGKMVRISELDVQGNPNKDKTSYTSDVAQAVATAYKNVAESYFQNVPAAQRAGITVWGTRDDASWLLQQTGVDQWPLLFDKTGSPKLAYQEFYKVLKAKGTLQ